METWKDINGYENKYKISSLGQVWSKTKGILNLNPSKSGYISVGLWKNNKRNVTSVHRLVATHFIDNPNNFLLVDHINNVRNNNNVNNLRWTDYSGNSLNMKRNSKYSVKGHVKYTDAELQNEIWIDATKVIDVLKNKEYFMVSNLGRYRYYKRNNRWNTFSIQTVSPKMSDSHYPQTTVRVGDIKHSFSIHKLVALCFLRKPKDGEVIDHIDSNTNNPRLNNLQIITVQENNQKANKNNDSGLNNGMSKSSYDDIIKVLNMFFFEKKSKTDISKQLKIAKTTVTRIVTGETYKNIYYNYITKYTNFPVRPTQSELQSIARKGKSQTKITCPHCNKTGGNTNMVRYHFDNCKNK